VCRVPITLPSNIWISSRFYLASALASRKEDDDTIDLAVLGGLKNEDALTP
jgi:hypothetical protein